MNQETRRRLMAIVLAVLAIPAVFVGGLLAYLHRQAAPTGFDEFVKTRSAKWQPLRGEAVQPPAAESSRTTKDVAAELFPDDPSVWGDSPAYPLPSNVSLGIPINDNGVGEFQFDVTASPATRSKNPTDWESLADDALLRTEAGKLRARRIARGESPMAGLQGKTPAELAARVDHLEALVFAQDFAPNDAQSIGLDDMLNSEELVYAARLPLLRAFLRGDRDKAAGYLLRYLDLEMEYYRNGFGSPRRDFCVFLAMLAEQPGFPNDALPGIQARFESMLMTADEFTAMRERFLIRAHHWTEAQIADPRRRRDNTWHLLLFGGPERMTSQVVMPAIRSQLQRQAMATISGDRAAASQAEEKLKFLMAIANVSDDVSPHTFRVFDLATDPPGQGTPGGSFIRLLKRNWEVETDIMLVAMLRYRADKGVLPRAGSDLVPDYVSDEFLRSTQSAWRFLTDQDGPVLVRFDPAWLSDALPGKGRIGFRPGGLAEVAQEDVDAAATNPQPFFATQIRSTWKLKAGEISKLLGLEGGS